MVEQLASELHGIMDDAVAYNSPAGAGAIEQWLSAVKGNGPFDFGPNHRLTREQTSRLINEGLAQAPGPLSKSSSHRILSSGFCRPGDPDPKALDLQLAWMMCFRNVLDKPNRVLRLGTTLRKRGEAIPHGLYVCMRPLCDSIRLTGRESFLLLPLKEATDKAFQIVVRVGGNGVQYHRVSVWMKMSDWLMVDFQADYRANSVVANERGGRYFFTDVCSDTYEWIGELKQEFAQGIANEFASELSRVALNKSEWLRRQEKR